MTDLEKRADEYAIKVAEKNVMPKDGFAEHLIRQTYLDATKAETALLSQHILDLQKDKGNLTDRVRELEQENEQIKNSDTLCKLIGEQKRKITELEAQLENLKPYRCKNHFQVSETGNAVVCYRVYDCKSCGQFKEIKEND